MLGRTPDRGPAATDGSAREPVEAERGPATREAEANGLGMRGDGEVVDAATVRLPGSARKLADVVESRRDDG